MTANPDQASVSVAVVTPSDLGTGWTLLPSPGGDVVTGEVTLDVCGSAGSFPSEALRTARHQVWYAPPGSSQPEISNEVVAYQSGGTQQAQQEVHAAVADCPHHPVAAAVADGPTAQYAISVLSAQHGWQPETIVLRERMTATSGQVLTQIAIYQFRGRFLSAVYGPASSDGSPTANEVHAADAASRRLDALPATS